MSIRFNSIALRQSSVPEQYTINIQADLDPPPPYRPRALSDTGTTLPTLPPPSYIAQTINSNFLVLPIPASHPHSITIAMPASTNIDLLERQIAPTTTSDKRQQLLPIWIAAGFCSTLLGLIVGLTIFGAIEKK